MRGLVKPLRRLCLALATAALLLTLSAGGGGGARPSLRGTVTGVVEGDTLVVRLDSGKRERVRLIGVDAPEPAGKCYSREAAAQARKLALGKTVVLVTDPSQPLRDRSKQLLAYVDLLPKRVDLGRRLIAGGFAVVSPSTRSFRRLRPYRAAEGAAKAAKAGLWRACSRPPEATDAYVSISGADSNPGTLDYPYRTVQHALGLAQPGWTIYVRQGTYAEEATCAREGTAAAPITLQANPGERPVLQPVPGLPGDHYALRIRCDYFNVRGFILENAYGTSSANVYAEPNVDHVEITDNEIRGSQDQGIFADRSSSYITIVRNVIHDNGFGHVPGQHQSHGLYIEGSNDLIANNVIYNHPFGFGIQLFPANHDTIVAENTIASSAHSSIVVGGSVGVYNITIRNNILADSANHGVEMDLACPTGPVYIDHNVIYAYRLTPIEGGCSNVVEGANILADPLFVDYANRTLSVQPGSPAIDTADPSAVYSPSVDGVGRPQGAGPDIGAYER